MGIRPQALLGAMCGAYGVMNLVPWGGPTMRAASVAGVEAGDLYGFMIPGVVCLAIAAFCIAIVVSMIEKKNGAEAGAHAQAADDANAEKKETKKGVYYFNLVLTLVMLVLLFRDLPVPLYSIFMVAFAIGLIVNFPNAKQQNKKIKEYGTNAMVMTMTLFSVPLLMILGTDAFYYALLPIIIGVVEPFGVAPETVAAAFLLTATFGTPVSPSVAATYVGLGLADVSIGDHIKYSLRLVWPASIAVLIMATVIGVIKF